MLVKTLHPYGVVAVAEFRSRLNYVAASLGGVLTQIVFGLIRTYIILAVLDGAGGTAGGYTRDLAITYVWLTQGLMAALGTYVPSGFLARIKDGDIAVDLLRPVEPQTHWLAVALGRGLFELIVRGIATFTFGMIVFGAALKVTVAGGLLGVVAVLFAIALAYYAQFIVAALGFWVVDSRPVVQFYFMVAVFFGGFMVPVHMFPDWLQQVAQLMPFMHIYQTPIDVLSGYTAGFAAVKTVAIQALWIVVTAVIGQVILRAGVRKVEVQGG